MQKKMFVNAGKIVLAAITAILAAQFLRLEFAVSAGIVAILTIQPTKRETIRTAAARLYAFITALAVAFASFGILGYNLVGFFVYLGVFILLCQFFQWHSAMAMNSVLISHFLTFGAMSPETVRNELLIFAIGVGAGIAANMHLRKRTDYTEKLIQDMDAQIVKILSRMSERIINKDITDYNGECFQVLADLIDQAKGIVAENYNNQLIREDTFDMEYVAMRDSQRMVLYEMYKNVRALDTSPITAEQISDFLKETANAFEKENDCRDLRERFHGLDVSMKQKPLPVERKEFEDRARLFCLLRNMETFLELKVTFFLKYKKSC